MLAGRINGYSDSPSLARSTCLLETMEPYARLAAPTRFSKNSGAYSKAINGTGHSSLV